MLNKGQKNKVKIAAVAPNQGAALIWGYQEGSGTLTTKECREIPVNISHTRVLGKIRANATRIIDTTFFVPLTRERMAFFQTVDLSTCVSISVQTLHDLPPSTR